MRNGTPAAKLKSNCIATSCSNGITILQSLDNSPDENRGGENCKPRLYECCMSAP